MKGPGIEDRGGRPRAGRFVTRLALLALLLVAAGELGHHVLGEIGATLAHHLFHIGFIGAAGLVFGAFVFREVRRNGWPSFGWRNQPRPDEKRSV